MSVHIGANIDPSNISDKTSVPSHTPVPSFRLMIAGNLWPFEYEMSHNAMTIETFGSLLATWTQRSNSHGATLSSSETNKM
jgi:hypothetical protein